MNDFKSNETLLKRLRIERFSSTTRFASVAGANRRTVSAHENGTRKIDAKYAKLYAEALELDDWRQLITGETKNLEVFISTHPTEVDLIMVIAGAIAAVSPSFSDDKRRSLLRQLASQSDTISRLKNGDLSAGELRREVISLARKKG
ncbi:helix-turn-helix domain-containing protein [Vibrio marisflavi]|uniref:HTH cro/C1-type domain-containing protein n=1 Tax=Vibrio marisflavi CECT 7928 TaxID=634439 RepID=A0ABM9A9R9_9VIBR|nr:helix-turn-helix transcriptional regulator [Vibrio marisflavi]CAH0543182.1 hypothetical protein VMF7928_04447 [Vibrio marisflavi CECT 7928]